MAKVSNPADSGERDRFLGRVHTNNELQMLLALPDARAAALAVASAAGFPVDLADLLAPARRSESPTSAAPSEEASVVDFDGDGIPDAVRQGDRWVLISQDD